MSFPEGRNKVLCRATATKLVLQGLGGMFRSSFEVMTTGAPAVKNRVKPWGLRRLLAVEGSEEVDKEVDRDVRSRLDGQDRMERL